MIFRFFVLRLSVMIFGLIVASVAWSWSATTVLVTTLLLTVVGWRFHNAGHNVVPHRARRPTTAGTGRAATFGTSAFGTSTFGNRTFGTSAFSTSASAASSVRRRCQSGGKKNRCNQLHV